MDANEIKKWHEVFYPQGGLFEIRLLGGKGRWKSASGYFTNVDTMIRQLEPILSQGYTYGSPSAYFTLNEIPEALYSREQHDKFVTGASSTKDDDIIRRKFVMMDFDPVRQAGISSSNIEFAAARTRMSKVYHYLKDLGFNEPVMAMSGNGWHLQYRVDMPNDDEHTQLVKDFIEAVARKYSDKTVDVDCKVFNAARICKLYGTEARKGSNTQERPWRQSAIKYVPKELQVNTDDLFRKAIESLPPKPQKAHGQPSPVGYSGNSVEYAERWLREYNRDYRVKEENGTTYLQLRHCYWEDTHTTPSNEFNDAAVCINSQGVISYTCRHAHCSDKRWEDAKLMDNPNYTPYRDKYLSPKGQTIIIQQAAKKEKKPEIKAENSELGPMWYEFDEIPDIDLDSLEKIETGITALDEKIMGLYLSEVTILSGTNSSGKSSFLNTLLLNAVDKGYKCALWSGELRADILKAWLDMVAAGKQHLTASTKNMGKFYVSKNVKEKINHWLHGKLILFNNNYGAKWEQIYSQMQEKQAQGFKLFVLDNLMKLDIDILGDRQNDKQKKMIENLGDFAKKYKTHIILVAHPRKSTGRGLNSFLRKDDIAGSSDLANLADNVFIIHRNNNDFRKGIAEYYGEETAQQYRTEETKNKKGDLIPRGTKWGVGNVIEICKNRLYGVVDELIDLYYEIESRRFKNYPNEVKEYGWNEDANAKEGDLNLDNKQNNNDNGLPFSQATDEAPF